jgi:phosphatidylinositol-3-phosphatase
VKVLVVCLWLGLFMAGCGSSGNQAAQLAATNADPPASAAAAAPPHVVLVVEENRSFSTVYPSGMPWLSALGNANGIATNYVSDESGSLLDYLWLSSGSGELGFGCSGGGCSKPITDDNIFRELSKAGLTWKVYADGLPSPGYMGGNTGEYVKRHNPAVWYSDVINSSAQQQNVVPFPQFAADLASNNLPNYSIIVPDLQNDAHDGTIANADKWLQLYVAPLLSSPYFKPGGNGVLFITFDNGDDDNAGHVFTAVVGPKVIPGVKVNTPFRHENTLRTTMKVLGLQPLANITSVAAMDEFFR